MSAKPEDRKQDEENEKDTEVAELAAIDSEELLKGGRAIKKEGVARTRIDEDLLEGGAEKKEKAKKAAEEGAGLPGFLAKKEAAKKAAADAEDEEELPLEGTRPDDEPGIGTEGEVKVEQPKAGAEGKAGSNSSTPEGAKPEKQDEEKDAAGKAEASEAAKQTDTP